MVHPKTIVVKASVIILLIACGILQDVFAGDKSEQSIIPDPVTGSFLELNYLSSPMSFTTITQRDISESGARNLTELLEIYVPGFQYMFNPYYGTLWGMRGISNDRNTKFIVLVNNHKLNMQSRDGFKSELVLGMLGDIERIEVLRGPASLVYGSGAIAGIVNIITRGDEVDTTEIAYSRGTFKEDELDSYFSRKVGSNSFVRGTFGWRKSDGLGRHDSRIYGKPGWPFPDSIYITDLNDTLNSEDIVTTGVPSEGSYGSTPGNYKLGFDWDWHINSRRKLKAYLRFTRQVENVGGWVIVDPWPQIEGSPLLKDLDTSIYVSTYHGSVVTKIEEGIDNIGTYRIITTADTPSPSRVYTPDTIMVYDSNGNFLGVSKDGKKFIPVYVEEEKNRKVDGETVTPKNTFWNSTESWGQNRLQHINDNLMLSLNYNQQLPENRFNVKHNVSVDFGFDKVKSVTGYEKLDGYEGLSIGKDNKFEEFNEQRMSVEVTYLVKPDDYNKKGIGWQIALGTEGNADAFGVGGHEWKGVKARKVIEDKEFFTGSIFGEMFLSRFSMNSEWTYNLNVGGRVTGSNRNLISREYIVEKKGFGAGMIGDGKLGLGIIPTSLFGVVEQSYKLFIETSQKYGSADAYLANRYNYQENGVLYDTAYLLDNNPNEMIYPIDGLDINIKPEINKTMEFSMTHSIYNRMFLLNSVSVGKVENLLAWSQKLYRVINSRNYNYFNVDTDFRFSNKKVTFGINHTYQRPWKAVSSDWIFFNKKDSVTQVEWESDAVQNMVGQAITADGKHFLNLSTNVSKLYATWRPFHWISLHSDCRLFWGIPGRDTIQNSDAGRNFTYWGIGNAGGVITKVDASIHFKFSSFVSLSLYGYNLLGVDNGEANMKNNKLVRNTLRMLYIADHGNSGLVSTDQQSFAAKMTVAF
jgi:hypothetical protein